MTNFAETTIDNIDIIPINDVNKIEKVIKPKKERSEKQKENDIKLKERLSEYHRKKREMKQMKEEIIKDTLEQFQEKVIVEKTDNNNIHQSEVTIQIDEFKKMNIEDIFEPKPKKVRGRPKSKEIIN